MKPLENPPTFLQDVAVAKCLVNVKKGKTVLHILKPTYKVVKLCPHKVVAKVSSLNLSEIHSPDPSTSTKKKTQIKPSCSKPTDSIPINFHLKDSCLLNEEKQKLLSFLQKNRSVFADSVKELGCTKYFNHHIDSIPGARPVRQAPYRQNTNTRAEQVRQVAELEKYGFIEHSTSKWACPVVMCLKKNGQMRMAIDDRKLNAVTIPQTFPLPAFDNVCGAIGQTKAQFFTSLVLKSDFYQVPLTEERKPLTSFVTQTCVYQFTRMPFDLMNSPLIF